ncbi:MAG TPA: hypothetical protein VFK58_01850 [Sphingomicrobium sp.]|nr:hypothetical protein [Sphingomicrobium sp.]
MRFQKIGYFVAGMALSALSACTAEQPRPAEPTLAEVKAGAERYRDVRNAIADGYTTDNKCVTAQMLGFPAVNGVMGLHYVRRDLLGLPPKPAPGRVSGTGTHTDFTKPAMLVYEPQVDGSLELVAVENLVFASEWHKTRQKPPQFRGVNYLLLKDDPATKLDEAHNFEPHYELHLWVFRDNPKGMYAPFNPAVTCRHHKPPAPHS